MTAASGVLTTENPDDGLLLRCQAGEMEAFAVLYARHEQQIFRYAYHQTGSREDADDIKQETFVRAWQAIGGFRRNSSVRTWLLRICANLCRDRQRSWEHRKVQYENGGDADAVARETDGDTPHTLLEQSERHALVRRALHTLPLPQRELLILHELEELSYADIGEILGCSSVSAKLRVFRARRLLRQRFEALSE